MTTTTYLLTPHAAAALGISVSTIRRWCQPAEGEATPLFVEGDHWRRRGPSPNGARVFNVQRCAEAMAAYGCHVPTEHAPTAPSAPTSPDEQPTPWCSYAAPLDDLSADSDTERDCNEIAAYNAAWALDYHLNKALDAALLVDEIRTIYGYPVECGPETPFQAIEIAVAKAEAQTLSREVG
jgi:hypothetical protein